MQLLQQQNLEVDSTLYVAELIYNLLPSVSPVCSVYKNMAVTTISRAGDRSGLGD